MAKSMRYGHRFTGSIACELTNFSHHTHAIKNERIHRELVENDIKINPFNSLMNLVFENK